MPTLMDALTAGQQQTAAGAASGQTASPTAGAGAQSSSTKLGQLLAAGRGSTAATPGIQGENLMESAASADTKQQAQNAGATTGADTQMQRTQYAGQQEQQQQAVTSEKRASDAVRTQYATKANQMLADFAAGEGALGLQKNQAAAEQLGFQMRLSNDQYVTRLNEEAAARRLDDAAAFQDELYKSEMGAALDVLKQKLGADVVLAGNAADFQGDLSKLTMQDWLNMEQYKAKSAAGAGVVGGLSGAISGAAKLSSASGDTSTPEDQNNTGAPLQSAQNPPSSPVFDASGNVNPGYTSPSTTPAYTPPGGTPAPAAADNGYSNRNANSNPNTDVEIAIPMG